MLELEVPHLGILLSAIILKEIIQIILMFTVIYNTKYINKIKK